MLCVRSQVDLQFQISNLQCNTTLTDCLDSLKNRSGISINYKSDALQGRPLRLTFKKNTLQEVLNAITYQSGTRYKVGSIGLISVVPSANLFLIQGYIVDATSREALANAEVNAGTLQKSFTNEHGYFRLYSPTRVVPLVVIKDGYQVLYHDLIVEQNRIYRLGIQPIPALKRINVTYSDSGVLTLRQFDEVGVGDRVLPSVGGELDALGEVKLLTGVQNVSFGDPGLIVRGGGPDQNFVVMDGIPVYNTFHILGLYSIFNSSSVQHIRVYKDAFPSKYNSRLSSVIDVGLRNGDKTKHHMEADVGLLSSGLSFNGPILKEKLSYSISARRSYADLLSAPVQRIMNKNSVQNQTSSLWYYDLYAKLHYQVNEKNEVEISGYNGGDQLAFTSSLQLLDAQETVESTTGALGWRNRLAGIQWRSNLSSKAVLALRSSFSGYRVTFSDAYAFEQKNAYFNSEQAYTNGVNEWRTTADVDLYLNSNNHMQIGAGNVNYTFIPFERNYHRTTSLGSLDTNLVSKKLTGTEQFVYIENKTYFDGGNITLGMRLAQFEARNARYRSLRPRVLIIQNLDKRKQLRFGFTTANQFLHLVPNNNLGLPLDIWLPVTEKIKPLSVTQFSTKLDVKMKRMRWTAALFSKLYTHVVEHESGTNMLLNENWDQRLLTGNGRAYGLELNINTSINNWKLYGAYTFSRSERVVEGVNNDEVYYSKYDRPHAFNLLAENEFNARNKVVITFTYASGNPVSLPTSRYVGLINGQEVIVEEFDEINNFRMPATHHLDFSYIHERKHKKFDSKWVLGVYNIYNQLNPFMVYLGLNEDADPVIKIRSFLPMMPMIKYSIRL